MEIEEKVIVLDTETTNSLDDPIVYDCGFAVVDKEGKVYDEKSFVVADVFLDEELMASAYFIDKIQDYWNDIKSGKRKLARFSTIRKVFADTCRKFEIKKVFAHNARFDYRSLTLTQRFLTSSKYRYFFPYGIEICDTLKMSRQVFGKDEKYGEFCYENDFLTQRGSRRYTAEILFRFLTGCLDFEESHTGLEDVKIEKEIMAECFRRNPNIEYKLWQDQALAKVRPGAAHFAQKDPHF